MHRIKEDETLKSSRNAADSVSSSGEDEKQAAANDPHHQRETLHDFVQFLGVAGEDAAGDAVVGEGDGGEDEDGHERVDEVTEADLVLVVLGDFDAEAGLEDCEAAGGDETVVDLAVGALEGVGEVEEEAGEAAEGEEGVDHVGGDGGALAAGVDRRQHHLEGEEGSGGEEVGEEGGFGERFLHAARDGAALAAAGGEGRDDGGRRRGGVERRWRRRRGFGGCVDPNADSLGRRFLHFSLFLLFFSDQGNDFQGFWIKWIEKFFGLKCRERESGFQ